MTKEQAEINVEKLRRKVGRINDVSMALEDAISYLTDSGDATRVGPISHLIDYGDT